MSETTYHDDEQVDPRLDALLTRALGRGGLTGEQRRRHLERLGLIARLGGSAGQWRAPVTGGRRLATATAQPRTAPTRRRHRQWAELGVAALAIVLVAALLVALFRDWGSADDEQIAASPEATAEASPTPPETREQLYVVSHVLSQNRDALITTGRVSALDPASGEEYWSVEAGPRIDSVLAPDGRSLFVADSGPDGDHLFALDTATGRELWRVPIQDRQWHKPNSGQSMLAVSPDGATVTVYSCEGCTGELRFTDGRNWLQHFDAATGDRRQNLDVPACRGIAWQAPDGPGIRPLYVLCDQGRQLEIVDPGSGQGVNLTHDVFIEGGFPDSTSADAHGISPDGRLLYLASGNRLSVIDMTRQAATRVQLAEDVDIRRRLPLLALSPDGTRLFVGSLDTTAFAEGRAEVGQVDVYDTASWERVGHIMTGTPLNGTAFAADRESVYGVSTDVPMTDEVVAESTIVRLPLDGGTTTVATRKNEEVLYLFSGTVEVAPDAAPLPTPTPAPTAQERLFAVSHLLGIGGDTIESGRVTAYDAVSGQIAYWIDTGINPDAVLSRDGTRLYVVANNEEGTGDILSANDAFSGDELWSVPIADRAQWQRGVGPTTLAVSPDGSRLFVYSATGPSGYHVQVFNTEDGAQIATIDGVAGCTAQLFPSPDNRSLYVVCLAEVAAPQVIDLETMTSAGIVLGFSGVNTAAATTADGSLLYITHDIDTELRLTVIDTNDRTITDQRDIVHLASDPLHALNLLALSPDGSRMFVGIGSEPPGSFSRASEVWVWDSAALHTGSIRSLGGTMTQITGWSLASGADNQSVFAIRDDTILRLSYNDLTAPSEEFARRPESEFLRLFTGRVTIVAATPETEAPEPNLRDVTSGWDDLPFGLTFSHHVWTGATSGKFVFIGDDGRAIEIVVRPWTEGDALDPLPGSTPVQHGSVTGYLTPDPEGGWPSHAAWQDARWVYSLTVVDGPPAGWTQDEILAVVAAISSETSGDVCPAATWTGPENRRFGDPPESYWIDDESLALGQAEGRLVEGVNKVTFVTAPGQQIVDPDPNTRVLMVGTRLGRYERAVPLELLDHTIDWNVPAGDGVSHFVRTSVVFPTFGCWQIEAEFGTSFLRAVVYVEPDYSIRNPALIWDTLRWRPLHELGIDSSPPCPIVAPQPRVNDFGPLVGDAQANAGPAFLGGPDVEGVIRIATEPVEAGGHYARVMFVTSGDYTGPLLVRPALSSRPIAFSTFAPDSEPVNELRLQDPGGTSPTGGWRHWTFYLRLSEPGCHALQLDGPDFTSIIVFEVVADAALNDALQTAAPWRDSGSSISTLRPSRRVSTMASGLNG